MRPLVQVLVAALCALGAVGCGGSGEQAASPAPASTTTQDVPSPASRREQAPRVAGRSLDDAPLSLADHRGRPVLVNIWSSW